MRAPTVVPSLRAVTLLFYVYVALIAPSGLRAQEASDGARPVAPEIPEALLRGHRAEVTWNATTVRGELLAVDPDTLWLLEGPAPIVRVPLAEVDRLRIRRHGWNTGRALLWAGIGGVVSGAALSMACGQVDDTDCGGVFLGTMATWALVGALAAISFEESGRLDVADPTEADVRRFTRFPQGLPHGFGEEPPADPPPGG